MKEVSFVFFHDTLLFYHIIFSFAREKGQYMQDKLLFRGIATALITPFEGGRVDTTAFRRLVGEQIKEGIHALVVAGTTGEASTLTEYERESLLDAALTEAEGRLPVIMGTGANDTAKAVSFTRRAATLGANGALVVTPYYNKGTKEGVRSHFLHIAFHMDESVPINYLN